MSHRTNVVVVDPQPLLRHGVANALSATRLFDIVGQGATAGDAVSLATEYTPKLIVMDVGAKDSALELVEQVAAASPTTRTILLTSLDDRELVESAFRAGVSGYLLKNVEVSELCQAASAVIDGEIYVSRKLIGHLFKSVKPSTVSFSTREEQILRLLAQGMSNKSIAFELSLSEKTAKYYLTTLMKKLHAKNRVEVALYAAARKTT
jgi:two-component system, NarL family, nitrate/nitrite response regulator NarL